MIKLEQFKTTGNIFQNIKTGFKQFKEKICKMDEIIENIIIEKGLSR